MSAKNQIILLQKDGERLSFCHSKRSNSLALIPSSLCVQSSFNAGVENPLLKAYQDKLLPQNQTYIPFIFSQKIQNKIMCFFAPLSLLSSNKFAMLDLSIPTQISIKKLCVLFVYPSNSLLCLYQDQTLQYSKIIYHHLEDVKVCKHYLQTLFEYTSTLYCLSYTHPLPEVLQSLHLTPLSSLFVSSPPDFGLYFEQITLIQQEGIIPLNSTPSQISKLFKFMSFSSMLFFLITFTFCFFTHSPLPIPKDDTHSIQILSTLQSLPSNKSLFILLQTLSQALKDASLMCMQFSNTTLTLIFQDSIPNNLITYLSSKDYVIKTINSTTLEIAL